MFEGFDSFLLVTSQERFELPHANVPRFIQPLLYRYLNTIIERPFVRTFD